MKIGIVSWPDNCRSHVKTLARNGHEAQILGGGGILIPLSLDALVLRTSCSKEAESTARAWALMTKKPLIEANGTVQIIQELEKLMTPWIEDLRPGYPAESTSPRDSWTQVVSLKKLSSQFEEAKTLYNSTDSSLLLKIRDTYCGELSISKKDGFFPQKFFVETSVQKAQAQEILNLAGHPLKFFIFLIKCLPLDLMLTRPNLSSAYFELTRGKKTDQRIIEAAAWTLGRELTYMGSAVPWSSFKVSKEPPAVQPSTPTLQDAKPRTPEVSDLSDHTINGVSTKSGGSQRPGFTPTNIPVDSFQASMFAEEPPETSLLRIQDIEERVVELTEGLLLARGAVSQVQRQNQELRNALDEMKLSILKSQISSGSGSDSPQTSEKSSDLILNALDSLMSRGAKITIQI